ncbi:Hsp20 family protein [Fredinandcohnia sp. QZ13]|uniref:Hsp20/alpha crystallin family protein n=1 Tax=Fredinandcohnia sp. QZ13 TaxID=3073144 RepID=UPI00285349E9|nr:Hsp20 family protein [Fredinandcohnia sp. QZ13]MDR4886387.1 Hsp20 family protein [Fredinandcohnia sp. QZ13]
MNNFDDSNPLSINGLEDWMKQFLEDPYLLDDYQFRIDLFETQNEYIIEAELSGYQPEQIQLHVKNDSILIKVTDYERPPNDTLLTERIVTLPFELEKKKIEALFRNEILEIYIKKNSKRKKKKSKIKIKVL